jgi:glycosyltransferase involved in cell wall biosynthesis
MQRSHHLLRQVAARHEVHLISFTQRGLLPTAAEVKLAVEQLSKIATSVSVFPIDSDRSRWRWVTLAASAFFRSSPYETAWLRSSEMEAAVKTALANSSFDLIHLDTIGLWPYGQSARASRILNYHNIESDMMFQRADRERHPVRRLYFKRDAVKLRRAEAASSLVADMNLVVSDLDATRLREVAPRAHVSVVDNGVDVDYFSPAAKAESIHHRLIFVGSMSWYPNVDALRYLTRDIWPELLADDQRYTLDVVGRNPPQDIVALASSDRRMQVTGLVDDVRPYLDRAEVYLCPIRLGGGTRLKILDALAMAKPLVATGFAVEGLDLEEEVHYLRAEEPKDFVSQVRRLCEDEALRRRLSTNARAAAVDRYSWTVIGQRLEQAYQTAMTNRALRRNS